VFSSRYLFGAARLHAVQFPAVPEHSLQSELHCLQIPASGNSPDRHGMMHSPFTKDLSILQVVQLKLDELVQVPHVG
jgi:hypothetical protein